MINIRVKTTQGSSSFYGISCGKEINTTWSADCCYRTTRVIKTEEKKKREISQGFPSYTSLTQALAGASINSSVPSPLFSFRNKPD